MGVSAALSASLSGLNVTRAQLDVLATNVANADTPGYSRKQLSQSAVFGGSNAIGVRGDTLDRQLDGLLQKQIRSELGAAGYTDVMAGYQDRLNTLLGAPGSASAFDSLVNNMATSLSSLEDNPASFTAQQAVLADATVLAQTLNAMSSDVQLMRSEAEEGIANSVRSINDALSRIEQVNTTILSVAGNSQVPADLLDERDRNIDLLAKEIDIQVLEQGNGSISIFTNSGVSLFDGTAAELKFDQVAALNPLSVYSTDPNERTVGAVTIGNGGADTLDLTSGNTIRSGSLASFIELRDDTFPEMQNRLDEFAHHLALTMSQRPQESVALNPAVVGSDGLQIDLAGIQPGNEVTFDYTDTVAGTNNRVTFVHVTDAASLPLSNDVTLDSSDSVIGVDLTDPAAVSAALTAAGIGMTAAAGAGGALQFIDDGAVGQYDINALSGVLTQTNTQSGSAALPMFTDGVENTSFYTASRDGQNQKVGFASRIQLNGALNENPSLLSKMDANTAAGDKTRAGFLYEQFTSAKVEVDPGTGIGANGSPLMTSLNAFGREIVNKTAFDSASATRANEGQQIVTNGLLARQSDESAVNIDQEMARLTELQSVYAANAQVMNAAREMMDLLLRI